MDKKDLKNLEEICAKLRAEKGLERVNSPYVLAEGERVEIVIQSENKEEYRVILPGDDLGNFSVEIKTPDGKILEVMDRRFLDIDDYDQSVSITIYDSNHPAVARGASPYDNEIACHTFQEKDLNRIDLK